MPPDGTLITFEGIDGCGKSTQARLLYERLRGRDVPCVLFREPGGTSFGEAVRDILLKSDSGGKGLDFGGMAETLLFTAARAELMRQVVKPLLDKGCVVILDRFIDSTVAYQGYGRGVAIDWIETLNSGVTGGRRPDVTFLIELEPKASLARLQRGFDRMEAGGEVFLKRVAEGFRAIAAKESARVMVIDGAQTVEEIARQVEERLKDLRFKI